MVDGTRKDSWIQHSSDIAYLLRIRGWQAHQDGFGRNLYFSYRSFLVAEAFIK
jgi:hypothetical protein